MGLAMGVSLVLQTFLAAASSEPPAGVESVLLWPGGAPGAVGEGEQDKPLLYLHLAAADRANGAAVVICPGGGYAGLAIGYEGHEVAQWLNTAGVSAFVLVYRHAPAYRHPIPLQDAQRALRLVRSRAAEWKLDEHRIGILGFSAGGHLSAMAGVHYTDGDPQAADPIERVSSRPDFLVLLYPVIAMAPPVGHAGVMKNLLGDDPSEALVRECSPHLLVDAKTPPTFIVHTTTDEVVPVENSVLFYQACARAGVAAEMHLFEQGHHGLGMGGERASGNPFGEWPQLCLQWLRVRGVLPGER